MKAGLRGLRKSRGSRSANRSLSSAALSAVFRVVALVEFRAKILTQETSCVAARGSSGLPDETDFPHARFPCRRDAPSRFAPTRYSRRSRDRCRDRAVALTTMRTRTIPDDGSGAIGATVPLFELVEDDGAVRFRRRLSRPAEVHRLLARQHLRRNYIVAAPRTAPDRIGRLRVARGHQVGAAADDSAQDRVHQLRRNIQNVGEQRPDAVTGARPSLSRPREAARPGSPSRPHWAASRSSARPHTAARTAPSSASMPARSLLFGKFPSS